ncbi:putative diguanylate cyclase YcdT [compost metagenome]
MSLLRLEPSVASQEAGDGGDIGQLHKLLTSPTYKGEHVSIVRSGRPRKKSRTRNGCACEVLSTTLGVADRFMTVKRQRDSVRLEADVLERLSERDALTGLFNRRAIEQNFEKFRAEGYRTLAVFGLDNFKAINDTHGHTVGDAVLKVVAKALQADPHVHAFRLGGEEFVLLLRGDDAQAQAERRRQAIAAIVANARSWPWAIRNCQHGHDEYAG